MKVVLLTDVKGQGKKDQIIDVSDGYARNFLLPRKLAAIADAAALNDAKNKEAARLHKIEVEKAAANETKAKLEGVLVKLHGTAGADGKLYGSFGSKDIAEALKEQTGIEIDRRKIVVDAPIKAFGTYQFEVKLYPEIAGKVNVLVAE